MKYCKKWKNFQAKLRVLLWMVPFIMISFSVLHAAWDPADVLVNSDLSSLEDNNFIRLKNDVKEFLKNSWCSQDKIDLLMDLVLLEKPQVCVEIGAFTGSSVLPVAMTLKHLGQGKIFAIDAWSNAEAVKYLDDDDPNKPWWSSVDMSAVLNTFKRTLAAWALNPYCSYIHAPSSVAVKDIEQIGEIDFLHLDGDYSETASVQDVQLYLPLVKSGGYVLISNLFTIVKGQQPKVKAFCLLFEECEQVSSIENDHAVLLRKI